MDPFEEQTKRERDMAQVRRELERKSQDIYRVYNPLEESVNYPQVGPRLAYVDRGTFIFFHDGYPNRIGPKQTKDLPWFKVRKYFDAISNFMIGQMALEKVTAIIEERRKRGLPDFLDKYVENQETWMKAPKLNSKPLLDEIREKVILGLVEEYGLEEVPQRAAEAPRIDTRSLSDQVLEGARHKIAPTEEEDVN